MIALLVLVTGCGNPRISPGPGSAGILSRTPTPELAQNLLASGDSVQAAHVYAQLAGTEADPLRQQEYQLLATELYFDNELYNDGARTFAALPPTMASEPLQQRRAIALAYYTIAQRDPQQALDLLPDLREQTDRTVRARALEARARALLMLNNPIQSLKARLQLEANLIDPLSINANRQRIWAMLMTLDPEALQSVARAPAGTLYRGWIEYALLSRAQPTMDTTTYERSITLWRNRFANHPAAIIAQGDLPDAPDLNTILAGAGSASISSGPVALLLPLTGQFSELGEAIKTGFTAAHYADGGIAFVRVYDTQSNNSKAIEQYQLAAAEGASLIIGPLSKPAVINLAASNQITVPTLSLNYLGEDIPGNSNLYQFGLLPEDEATDAANYANLNNYKNALVIHADTPIAQRLAAAFDKRFTDTGGQMLGTAVVEADTYDYSRQLRQLLAIDSSNARKRRLEKLLDESLEFEPAIRSDIDVIFMAVDADQARLLRPQLKFHRAGKVPVLSTAMVFSGVADAKADIDLTGVRYNEIPWLLSEIPAQTALYKKIKPYTQEDSAGFSRLNALGIDAYLLHKELEQMRLDTFYSVNGKTGALSLNQGNRVQRRLHWAEFQEGVPEIASEAIPVDATLPPVLNREL